MNVPGARFSGPFRQLKKLRRCSHVWDLSVNALRDVVLRWAICATGAPATIQ